MTEVTFHYNVADRVGYVCRAVRSVAAKGKQVVVTGEPGVLRELDSALWTFEPLEFIAHCYTATAPAEVVAASPVVLADSTEGAPHQQVLVNLGPGVAAGFERFERLVEVVTQDDAGRLDGRARARHYRDRGYPVRHYDTVTKELALMATRTPPKFVPTLTEVVSQAQAAQPAGAASLLGISEEQWVHRIMQRVDLTLDRRLREAIATVVLEQTRSLAPLLHEQVERTVREAVSEALAEEMAAASRRVSP